MENTLINKPKIPLILIRIAQLQALKRIKKISKGTVINNEEPKKIIFNRVYTTYTKSFYHVIGLAKALQLMGHNIKFLICDTRFKNCTSVFSIQQKDSKTICKNCALFGSEILTACNIPFDTYTNILKDEKRELPISNEVEKCINNSTIRYFKGIDNFPEHPLFDTIKKDRSCNATDSLKVAKIIYDKEKPDIVFTGHYAYSEWAPFTEYMQKRGVRCVVWNYIYGDTHLIFDLGKLSLMFTRYKKQHPLLTADEYSTLQNYLNERKYGMADTQTYGFESDKGPTLEKEYNNVCAMFPNVPWDSSLADANKIFNSMYEWIDDTINYFRTHQNNFLYIKIHPAEIIDKSQKTVADYIINNHFPLPDNIKIINVDEKISPYLLYDKIDTGIVYNGTAGLEMSIFGVPAIVVGHIYYEAQGFTYEPNNIEEYHHLLENPLSRNNKEKIKKAEEFGYYYFIKSRVPLTYVTRDRLGAKFVFKDFNTLLDDKNTRITCDYILHDILYQRGSSDETN